MSGHGCFRILPANVMRWRWDTKIVVSSFVAGLSRNPCCRPVAFPRLCSARRPYAACLHITPFPAVACFPLPKACACRARTCWGFLRPVPAFSGPLPRHSPFPFVVKTIYTYANFTSIKISYMYMLNQKIPPTPRRLGGHARQGTKSPSRGGARRYQKTYGKIY